MGSTFSSTTSFIILAESAANNSAIFKELDDSPHLLTYRDMDGNTILHRACKGGNRALAAELIRRGADVHAFNMAGITPLHAAAWEGHEEVVILLLEHGVNINARGTLDVKKICSFVIGLTLCDDYLV
jgi:ankyrin repeat protein